MFKKIAIVPVVALVFSLIGFTAVASADTATSTMGSSTGSSMMMNMPNSNQVEIDVMTHLCNPNIKNMADFQALSNGKSVAAGFANQVLNCPATVLPANMPSPGAVADPQTNFNFSVVGEHGTNQTLADSMFHQEKLCESDINVDVNGDGTISPNTCLDTSEYHFNNVVADNGRVEVTEMTPPQGYHYGDLRFTPTQLDGNNDQQSLISMDPVQGRIQLDTTHDADKVITLHVYDFVNSDNPTGLVNGMPIPTPGMMMGSTTGTTTMGTGTTTNMSVISQIQALEQQIQNLESQLNALLHQLM